MHSTAASPNSRPYKHVKAHKNANMYVGNICILRGLEVATERQWYGQNNVNDCAGAKKVDCDARTAIEDVSKQPEITFISSGSDKE